MASEKQKAASRANGARSRGPVTPEGRLRSSRNNIERGMLARTVVLDGESRPRFDALMTSLLNEHEMRFDRQFTRALHGFERFRATRTRHVQQIKTPEVQQ
jgi:hypothetical protein